MSKTSQSPTRAPEIISDPSREYAQAFISKFFVRELTPKQTEKALNHIAVAFTKAKSVLIEARELAPIVVCLCHIKTLSRVGMQTSISELLKLMNDIFYQAGRCIPPEYRTAIDGTKRDKWIEDAIECCVYNGWLISRPSKPEYSVMTTQQGLQKLKSFVSESDHWIGRVSHCTAMPSCPEGVGEDNHQLLYAAVEKQGNNVFKTSKIVCQCSPRHKQDWFNAMCALVPPYLLKNGECKSRSYIRAASDKIPKRFISQ